MFTVNLPVITSNFLRGDRAHTAAVMKEAGVHTVLLANGSFKLKPEDRKKEMQELKIAADYLKAEGFTVGCWYWTFLIEEENPFTKMVGLDGHVSSRSCCPMDETYIRFVSDYVAELAGIGLSLILFDDDFRYGHLDMGLGCMCEHHTKAIQDKLGEQSELSDFTAKAFTGGQNRYRDAWLAVRGDALRQFAQRIRESVDKVDPTVRIGICSCITSWGVDGVEATELARILAGGTEPYLRLIGAPYWAVNQSWGNRLEDVIETERMEAVRACGSGIQVFSEGDAFPRPRHSCPASYLEAFDLALLADGKTDGIMKYMLDYHSDTDYETGYLKAHQKNMTVRTRVRKIFKDKQSVGLRVYEYNDKLKYHDFGARPLDTGRIQDMLFSRAARFAANNTIPTTYDGQSTAGIVFGSNAALLPDAALDHGLILDVGAARLLTERGVDVGIVSLGQETRLCRGEEYYKAENQYTRPTSCYAVQAILRESVLLLSETVEPDGTRIPIAYRYENEKGQRFLVYLIEAADLRDDSFYRNYARQRQLYAGIEWLMRRPLPAVCPGHPDLYILCSRNGNRLSVGLWNLSPDAIANAEITLCAPASAIACIRCSAKANGRTVSLSTDIHAFEFAAFEAVLEDE